MERSGATARTTDNTTCPGEAGSLLAPCFPSRIGASWDTISSAHQEILVALLNLEVPEQAPLLESFLDLDQTILDALRLASAHAILTAICFA